MLTKTSLALAAATSLVLSSLVLTPATAFAASKLIPVNYSHCYEHPSALKCPGYFKSEQDTLPGNLDDNPFVRAAHERRVSISERS